MKVGVWHVLVSGHGLYPIASICPAFLLFTAHNYFLSEGDLFYM